MEQRLSFVTLGAQDLFRLRMFYRQLGFVEHAKSQEKVVFFQMNGFVLALYNYLDLAKDAYGSQATLRQVYQVTGANTERAVEAQSIFKGFALAYNVQNPQEVADTLVLAQKAGARILKPAQKVFWGGINGYFSDPEDNIWEVAWNPSGLLQENGDFII